MDSFPPSSSPPYPPMNGSTGLRRPHSRHGSEDNDDMAGDGETSMTQTLLRVLVDDLRDIKQENARLRRKVSKLQTHRNESEQRMQDMQRAMDAMADAHRESAQQIATLMALFRESPPSTLPLSSTFPSSFSSSPSSSLMVASSGPRLSDLLGAASGVSDELVQALPFLADYDCSSLIVSHLQEPFLVMRMPQFSSLGQRSHMPTVAYLSPVASGFLGYDPDEVVGKPIRLLGGIDLEAKLTLMKLMFTIPSSRVGTTALVKSVYVPKTRPSTLMETQHQSLWVNSQPRWHFVRFMRVLEEGVPVPKDWTIEEILRDPHAQAAIDANLASLPLPLLHPLWKLRACLLAPSSSSSSPTSQDSSPPTSSSSSSAENFHEDTTFLPAGSASVASDQHNRYEGERQRETTPVSPATQTMDGIDLEEMLRTLRSPVPPTPPSGQTSEYLWNSPSPSPSSILDESWLTHQHRHASS